MMSLMKELEKLAPHPDRPNQTGPHFVKIDSQHKPAAEYEGVLGSMVLESALGTAFIEAASTQLGSWAQTFSNHIDVSNAVDCASYYAEDRSSSYKYSLGQTNAISSNFNKHVKRKDMMDAYIKDLPKRLGIESWLASYQRKLYALHKQSLGLAV